MSAQKRSRRTPGYVVFWRRRNGRRVFPTAPLNGPCAFTELPRTDFSPSWFAQPRISEHAFDAVPVADGVINSVGRLLAALPAYELNLAYKAAVVTRPGNFMALTPTPRTFTEVPPRFSDRSFDDLISIVFKDNTILTLDHEIWNVLENGSDK